MTKAELIERVAVATDVTKKQAEAILGSMEEAVIVDARDIQLALFPHRLHAGEKARGLPLLHAHADAPRDQEVRTEQGMTASRRDFLKGVGGAAVLAAAGGTRRHAAVRRGAQRHRERHDRVDPGNRKQH